MRTIHRSTKWKRNTSILALVLMACGMQANAYTVIQGPPALETSFIASTTNQYSANLIVNQFFPDTYDIRLIGLNPNYNPAPNNMNLLNALVTVDSYTYVAGWANGESYQEFQQWNATASMGPLCANATNFALLETSTKTFDTATCQDVVGTIANIIFQLQSSSPTTVPGNWQ